MSNSKKGEASLSFRLAEARLLGILGRIRETMGSLSEEDRRQLESYLIIRPATPGGYTIVPSDLWATVIRGLRDGLKAISNFNESLEDAQEKVRKRSKGPEARKETSRKRREVIDALLNDGYLRSEIYEQMRLNYGGLIPGRGKEYMEEDSMWESYKVAGGCHSKAIQLRGRPRKNKGNCNNGIQSKK